MPLMFPGYFKATPTAQVGVKTWLKYAWKRTPEWREESSEEWISKWWSEVKTANALIGQKNPDLQARLTDCLAVKRNHDVIASKYYTTKCKEEEHRESIAHAEGVVEAYSLLKNVGEGVAHVRKKSKVYHLDSDGQGLPSLMIETPPSSPQLVGAVGPVVQIARPAGTTIAQVGTVQRRLVRLLEVSMDEFISANCPSVSATDPAERVHEARSTFSTKCMPWVSQRWLFHAALDGHLEPGNVIRHRRPAWTSDYDAMAATAKALEATLILNSRNATTRAAALFLYVAGAVYNGVRPSVPPDVTLARCGSTPRLLSDIPALDGYEVKALLTPIVTRAENELKAFLLAHSNYFPKVRERDDFRRMLVKVENTQLLELHGCKRAPLHDLPIQRKFWTEAGQTVLGTARWARIAARAFDNLGQDVRLENAFLVLAGIHDLILMLWTPGPLARQRNDVAFVTCGMDAVLGAFFAKITVVDLRRLPIPDADDDETESEAEEEWLRSDEDEGGVAGGTGEDDEGTVFTSEAEKEPWEDDAENDDDQEVSGGESGFKVDENPRDLRSGDKSGSDGRCSEHDDDADRDRDLEPKESDDEESLALKAKLRLLRKKERMRKEIAALQEKLEE